MRKHITIKLDDSVKYEVGTKIHEQLVGNQDYMDSRILLNIDDPGEINLFVMSDAKPCEIKIEL